MYNQQATLTYRVKCPFSHDPDGRHEIKICTKQARDKFILRPVFDHIETECFTIAGAAFRVLQQGCAAEEHKILEQLSATNTYDGDLLVSVVLAEIARSSSYRTAASRKANTTELTKLKNVAQRRLILAKENLMCAATGMLVAPDLNKDAIQETGTGHCTVRWTTRDSATCTTCWVATKDSHHLYSVRHKKQRELWLNRVQRATSTKVTGTVVDRANVCKKLYKETLDNMTSKQFRVYLNFLSYDLYDFSSEPIETDYRLVTHNVPEFTHSVLADRCKLEVRRAHRKAHKAGK